MCLGYTPVYTAESWTSCQVLGMGSITATPLTINTGAPQGCVLNPLPLLYVDHCAALYSSNMAIKFTDDTTVICLITNNDE